MQKPKPTRAQLDRVRKTSQARVRLELVIDFDHPVTVARAREAARKLLDALDLNAGTVDLPEGFGEANLKCAELRRILRVQVTPAEKAEE